jgi:CheY-like chemotaxis protein
MMDLHMPLMDGIEAAKQIRKTNSIIPIIPFSANVFNEKEKECAEAGMNDFMPKPFKQEDLTGIFSKYVLN